MSFAIPNPRQVAASAPFIPGAVDVVGVYSQDYTQVFRNARPMKAVVKPDAQLMKHPVETGATVIDNRIINPTLIELFLFLGANEFRDTYQQIKQLWLNGTLLIVQTKTDTYTNQLIAGLPHEEDPDVYDGIIVALKLEEVLFSTAQYGTIQPANPADSTTVDRGNIQPTPATAPNSILFDWFG